MNERPSWDGLFFDVYWPLRSWHLVWHCRRILAAAALLAGQLAARISVSGFTFWFILKRFCGS